MSPAELNARIAALPASKRALLETRLRARLPEDGARSDQPFTRLVSWYEPSGQSRPPGPVELREFLSRTLPEHMVPWRYEALDALPLSPNGKVDRRALEEKLQDREPVGERTPPAGDALENRVHRIWTGVLSKQQIGLDDNFFEMGGHSLLVATLIQRLRAELGIDVPLRTVFDAPTVRSFTRALRSGQVPHSSRCLVEIKKGVGRHPLFLVHGLGGGVSDHYDLAMHLSREQPVFALQAPPRPYSEIPPMAAHYLREVREAQPEGPYLVGGYCMGGNVAYEMAVQLLEAGEQVELLVLIDSAPPADLLRAPASVGAIAARRARRLAGKSFQEIVTSIRHHVAMLARRFARMIAATSDTGFKLEIEDLMDVSAIPDAFLETAAVHFRALRDYLPEPSPVDACVFRSDDPQNGHLGPSLGWDRLVEGDLRVFPASGNHETIMKSPNIEALARDLDGVLPETGASSHRSA